MTPHKMRLPVWESVFAALALIALSGLIGPAGAQEATPTVTVAVTRMTATPVGTPTPTRTPTIIPSPTPTFTALEARLALARAYLDGGDFQNAIAIYSAIALEDRGNPEALAGLNEALAAQAGATATAAAPAPTVAPPTPEPAPEPGFAETFAARLSSFTATALALGLAIGLAYVALRVVRWLAGWLRDLWLMRVRPLLGRPPVPPSIAVSEFVDATGQTDYVEPEIVASTIEETLVHWNAAVPPALATPVHTRPLDRAGLNWLGALWARVSPPPRTHLVTGLLLGQEPGPYCLSVERLDLRTNEVDASRTFESAGGPPAQAFRDMAAMAAYWLRDPHAMQASPELLASATAAGAADAVVKLLIPVRQQALAKRVDYATAPRALDEAQALVNTLPAGSSLRDDLQAAVDDLRRQVQPGRA
jgi:hypothetical protein